MTQLTNNIKSSRPELVAKEILGHNTRGFGLQNSKLLEKNDFLNIP